MDSRYKRNKNRRKNTSKIQSQTHKTSNIPKNKKNTKNNKKNNILKGSNPNDTHMSGRKLNEQAFQNDKADSILENKNHQEGITKIFTLARKLVDKV